MKGVIVLYICEKPDLARAVVEGLGGGTKKKGFYICGPDRVTWCFGHMLQLCDPEDYDPDLRKWRMEHLPMILLPWRKKPIQNSKEQLDCILSLLKTVDTVVHTGDPDAEGQLLVDEILDYAKYKGKVKRLLINDNNPIVVKKALASLRDNSEFAGLSRAALLRELSDFLYGINMTRLYTLAARQQGSTDIISIGRVQTAVLGLVVRRDRQFASHHKQHYYTVHGVFRFGDSRITAAYHVRPNDPQDSSGKLAEAEAAQAIADSMTNQAVTVQSVVVSKGESAPPLPYNLLKLQSAASKRFGLLPDRVKEITQALREKHRLITYNRSDCQYLSDEQHQDAPAVLAAVGQNIAELSDSIAKADPAIKGKAFNSAKVSAHHAIIPTQTAVDFAALSADEQRVYTLIAKAYLLQFMPNHQYETQTVTFAIGDIQFVRTGKITVVPGWKTAFEGEKDDDEEGFETSGTPLTEGQEGSCLTGECEKKATTPKPLFTVSGLLENLTNVTGDLLDDGLRKSFVEKDKGRAGEHGGIGTPATRDEILKTLIERGYVELQKKGKSQTIISTKLGCDVYDMLPDHMKYPDMTAVWHEQQREVEKGVLSIDSCLDDLALHIGKEVARVLYEGVKLDIEKHPCPTCGKAMLRQRNFWGCSNFPVCRTSLPDDHGKPGKRNVQIADPDVLCPKCKSPMVLRKHRSGGFYGCSAYPQCRKTLTVDSVKAAKNFKNN